MSLSYEQIIEAVNILEDRGVNVYEPGKVLPMNTGAIYAQ